MRTTALLLLVLLVAGGAWFLLAGRDAHDDDGEGIERTVDDEEHTDLVTLRGRSGAEALDAAAGKDAREADEPEDVEAESRFLLRGTLLEFDASRVGVAAVRVLPVRSGWADESWKTADGAADADGRFELDVTGLMAFPGELTHLEVRVDHPAYVQGRARADVAAVRAAGHGVLSVEITLHLGLAVTGEVRDERGVPIADADVAIFAGRSAPAGRDAPMKETADAHVRTDAEGRYRLRIATHGFYRVVAATGERLPAGTVVNVPQGGAARVPPLVLHPGVAIAGRVRFRETWVGGVWIKAVPEGHERRVPVGRRRMVPLEVGQRALAWTPDGPVPTTAWVQADEQGRFRFAGLAPGVHTVDPAHARSARLPHLTHAASEGLAQEVTAPAADLVLEIGGAVLEVRVVGAGQPVVDAEIEIETGGRGLFVRTNEESVARFLVVPSAPCTLRVRKEGFHDGALQITAGAARTTEVATVELLPAAPAPKLFVSFTGPHVQAVEQAAFSLEDPAEPGRMALDRYLRDEEKTGTYRVPDVKPGRYRLTVRPGEGMWGAFGYFLPEVLEVVIPTEGEERLEIPLRLGGRLRIAARDAQGALLEADCEIRDASGETLAVKFTAQAETMATTGVGRLGALSPSIVGPPLPAGSYTIELSLDGYHQQTVVAEVKASETTNVDVTLRGR